MGWDPDRQEYIPPNVNFDLREDELDDSDDEDTISDLARGFKVPMSERIESYKYPEGHRHANNPYINTSSKLGTLKGLRKNAESQRQIISKEQEIVEVASFAIKE